jgi:hypothetical protein
MSMSFSLASWSNAQLSLLRLTKGMACVSWVPEMPWRERLLPLDGDGDLDDDCELAYAFDRGLKVSLMLLPLML